MNKKVRVVLYYAIVVVLCLATWTSIQFPESSFWSPSGIWSILPPLVAIALAFATKNVLISLLVGIFSAAYLLSLKSNSPITALFDSFSIASQQMLNVTAKPGNAGILLQCGAIGGLVALLAASGGLRAIAEKFVKLARGPASAQIVTWVLGLFIFFDDYANVQIRGPIVRPITDRNRVSREKLSFILDATAAPIAGIALISTWIGTELSYISSGLIDAGLADSIQPYNLFVSSIPYRFYNLLMLVFIFLSAVMLRDFGSMYKAEVLARKGYLRDMNLNLVTVEEAMSGASDGLKSGDPLDGTNEKAAQEGVMQGAGGSNETSKAEKRASWGEALFALVPLATLIVAAFGFFYASGRTAILASNDEATIAGIQHFNADSIRSILGAADAAVSIFRAALLAGIVAFIMAVCAKRTTASEAVNAWMGGVKSLSFTFVILILAWTLSTCINKDNLGTAKFLVSALSNDTPAFLLPSLIFVFAAIVSFSTGTSYGTMAIITPLAIPFANALCPGDYTYLVASTSAVLTGAIFGDHSSPISDTTILSATSARCGMLEHVGTQIPYALYVGAIAIVFGFLPVGFGISVWIVLPISVVAILALLLLKGKKVPNISEDKPENDVC